MERKQENECAVDPTLVERFKEFANVSRLACLVPFKVAFQFDRQAGIFVTLDDIQPPGPNVGCTSKSGASKFGYR